MKPAHPKRWWKGRAGEGGGHINTLLLLPNHVPQLRCDAMHPLIDPLVLAPLPLLPRYRTLDESIAYQWRCLCLLNSFDDFLLLQRLEAQ
jgi:hypothetical protein